MLKLVDGTITRSGQTALAWIITGNLDGGNQTTYAWFETVDKKFPKKPVEYKTRFELESILDANKDIKVLGDDTCPTVKNSFLAMLTVSDKFPTNKLAILSLSHSFFDHEECTSWLSKSGVVAAAITADKIKNVCHVVVTKEVVDTPDGEKIINFLKLKSKTGSGRNGLIFSLAYTDADSDKTTEIVNSHYRNKADIIKNGFDVSAETNVVAVVAEYY